MILEELLREERFRYLKVLNKNADLSRDVMTVESTETPDVEKYIPQNTFLLMTGMAFQNNPQLLCEFLEALNGHDCAGIAIKLGRYVDELDEYVLETADRLGIPLFQIPMNMTLGEVYHEILSYIWNNQNDNFLNAVNIQRNISSLILRGSSMKNILNNLTAILNKPVMAVDMFGKIQDYGYTFSKADRKKGVEIIEKLMNNGALEKDSYYLYEEEEKNIVSIQSKG
ncbi:MAG: PucR family transcriptional regulator ligand-binding domain-containing protein [Ruminococcus sp.]|nr:PucR family transcriptional regulator ligand-binding domain-containing protein [Ruminococcus sp.]